MASFSRNKEFKHVENVSFAAHGGALCIVISTIAITGPSALEAPAGLEALAALESALALA